MGENIRLASFTHKKQVTIARYRRRDPFPRHNRIAGGAHDSRCGDAQPNPNQQRCDESGQCQPRKKMDADDAAKDADDEGKKADGKRRIKSTNPPRRRFIDFRLCRMITRVRRIWMRTNL